MRVTDLPGGSQVPDSGQTSQQGHKQPDKHHTV